LVKNRSTWKRVAERVHSGNGARFEDVSADAHVEPVVMRRDRQEKGDWQQDQQRQAQPEKVVTTGWVCHEGM
jgi:hypothetical protein